MKVYTDYNAIAVAVLWAWIPLIFLLFALMPARRAVIISFVFGYLMLPDVSFYIHTLPNISKVSLTALGVVLASLVYDSRTLFSVRPRLIDLPAAVLIVASMATSLVNFGVNGIGIMDGFSSAFNMLLTWSLAYWIGRAYFTDWAAIRELALGVVAGAIAYMPLCWFETKMSPMLSLLCYGMDTASYRDDNYLFGMHLYGWRPNIFLSNGLSVTMFMGTSTVIAFWLWLTGSPRKFFRVSMGWIAFALFFTTVISCKAMGGITLMMLGILALLLVKYWPKTRLGVLTLMLAAPLYIFVRTSGDWSGDFLVDAASVLSHTRADSLEFRLKNEDLLAAKAMERPLLGWGGWSRSHVFDLDGNDITISDGLWIITLGERGMVGLLALVAMVMGSAFLVWRRIPVKFWTDPACAAAVAMAVVITLYMIDSLFNATFNPVAALSAGGVASIGDLALRTFAGKNLRAQPVPVAVPAAQPATVASVDDLRYVYSAARN